MLRGGARPGGARIAALYPRVCLLVQARATRTRTSSSVVHQRFPHWQALTACNACVQLTTHAHITSHNITTLRMRAHALAALFALLAAHAINTSPRAGGALGTGSAVSRASDGGFRGDSASPSRADTLTPIYAENGAGDARWLSSVNGGMASGFAGDATLRLSGVTGSARLVIAQEWSCTALLLAMLGCSSPRAAAPSNFYATRIFFFASLLTLLVAEPTPSQTPSGTPSISLSRTSSPTQTLSATRQPPIMNYSDPGPIASKVAKLVGDSVAYARMFPSVVPEFHFFGATLVTMVVSIMSFNSTNSTRCADVNNAGLQLSFGNIASMLSLTNSWSSASCSLTINPPANLSSIYFTTSNSSMSPLRLNVTFNATTTYASSFVFNFPEVQLPTCGDYDFVVYRGPSCGSACNGPSACPEPNSVAFVSGLRPSAPAGPTVNGSEGVPLLIFPDLNATWVRSTTASPPSVFSVDVTIPRGCTSADTFTYSLADISPEDITITHILSSSCSADIHLASSAAPDRLLSIFTAVLRTLTLNATSRNAVSGNFLRTIKVALVGSATTMAVGFVSARIDPVNDAPALNASSPTVFLPEGSPPDFAVVIMSACPPNATVLGLPTVCLVDPDPPFLRRDDAVDAYSGASRATALAAGTAYALNFTAVTYTQPESACEPQSNASITSVGAPVYDCSARPVDADSGFASAPVACWWQRFRVRVGLAPATTGVPCSGPCALDYEAAYCSNMASAMASVPRGLSVSATLNVNDTWAGASLFSKIFVDVKLVDVADEPIVVVKPDATLLANLGVTADIAMNATIDDRSGALYRGPGRDALTSPPVLFAVCTQTDPGRNDLNVSLATLPLEGAAALPSGTTVSTFFNATPVGSARAVLLSSAAPCAAAFTSSGASAILPITSDIFSWTFAQAFTVGVVRGADLSTIPARTLTLQALDGAGRSAVTFTLTIARANRPVAFAPAVPATVVENAAPGTIVTVLNATDADAEQDVVFYVANSTLISCKTASGPALPVSVPATPGLFTVQGVANSSTVYDYATGTYVVTNTTRSARVLIGLDALDIDAPARSVGFLQTAAYSCTFLLAISATDSGDVSSTHSLLAHQVPTMVVTMLSVIVTNDVADDSPNVMSILGAPSAGLSTAGAQSIELVGYFGAVAPSTTTIPYNFSAWLLGPLGERFPLVNCSVSVRLTRFRCTTSAGWGSRGVVVVLSPFGVKMLSSPPLLTYRAPTSVAVALNASLPGAWAANLSYDAVFAARAAAVNHTSALAGVKSAPSTAAPLRNFSVLVADVPSADALRAYSRCALVSAALILDDAAQSFVSCGACAPSLFGVGALGATLVPSSALSRSATLGTSSWFTCALPPHLSSGSWLRVVVNASVLPSAACVRSLAPVSTGVVSLQSELSNYAVAAVAALTVELPPPSINVTQRAPGGAFTVCGSRLGSVASADTGDAIEYEATPACSAASYSSSVSCALHTAVNCTYTAGSCVNCTLDPRGWGAKFHVRAVVSGQVSKWSASTIAYAPPLLEHVEVVTSAGASASSASALAPGGGSLLLLRGANFWPPMALNITVGGVRAVPVTARPLSLAGRLQPLCDMSTCFGNEHLLWRDAALSANASVQTLLVTAPPGVGNVSVVISQGLATSRVLVSYASSSIVSAEIFSGAKEDPSFTMLARVVALPPCALCLNGNPKLCTFAPPQRGTIIDSALRATNSLPVPFSSNLSTRCAFPDDVSSATFLVSFSSDATAEPVEASFRASLGGDFLKFLVNRSTQLDTDTLRFTTFSPNPDAATFPIKWQSQAASNPSIINIFPSTWHPTGGDIVTLNVNNVGITGRFEVRIAPISLLMSATNSSIVLDKTASIGCFLTPASQFTTTNFDKTSKTVVAVSALGSNTTMNTTDSSYWDGTAWKTSESALPCAITSWSGSTVPQPGGVIKLRTPAWVGGVQVWVVSGASPSSTFSSIRILGPTINTITPLNGTTSGSNVTITGTNFGPFKSMGAIWRLLGAQQISAIALSSEPDYGRSLVYFQYLTKSNVWYKEPFYRECRVNYWSDTLITCLAPEAIAGSRNVITVTANWSSNSKLTTTWLPPSPPESSAPPLFVFTYDNPVLSALRYDPKQPSYVGLIGSGLSRINLATLSALSMVGLSAAPLFGPDASAGGYWLPPTVNIQSKKSNTSSILGLISGETLLNRRVVFLTHAAAVADIPPNDIEGIVQVQLQLKSNDSAVITSNWFDFDTSSLFPPRIDSVRVVPKFAGDDADPCAVLGVAVPATGRTLSQSCAASAQAVVNLTASLDSAKSCVRTTKDSAGLGARLLISGARFGSGEWSGAGVWLAPPGTAASALADVANPLTSTDAKLAALSAAVSTGAAFSCVRANTSLPSVWQSSSSLLCDIAPPQGGLPTGPLVVIVASAFTVANSSAVNVLQGACTCGLYAPATGAACLPCPAGASCSGGFDGPRAIVDMWRTIPDEWQVRGIDTSKTMVAPFVECPTKGLCLPDNVCQYGSEGFMCTTCSYAFVHDSAGACVPCSPSKSITAIIVVASGAAGLLLCFFALRALCSERCSARIESSRAALLARSELRMSTADEAAMRAELAAPRLVPLLKIALTFAQSFGAFSSYVSGNRVYKTIKGDKKLIPWLVQQLSVFTSLGFNTAEFKCGFTVDTNGRIFVFLVAPVVVTAALLVTWYPVRAVFNGVRSCLRWLRKEPPTPPIMTQPYYTVVAVLFMLVPIVVSGLAHAQDCAPIEQGAYLVDDPSTSCKLGSFQRLQNIAYYMGYVYLAFPVFAGVSLYSRSIVAERVFAFLTEGYRSSNRLARAWESITLLRKVLLIGFASSFVYLKDSRTQMIASMGLVAFSLAAQLRVKPFILKTLNDLDVLNMVATLCVAFAVVTRVQVSLSPGTAPSAIEQDAIDAFALATCVPFALLWVANVVDALLGGVPFLAARNACACKRARALSHAISQRYLRPANWRSSRALATSTGRDAAVLNPFHAASAEVSGADGDLNQEDGPVLNPLLCATSDEAGGADGDLHREGGLVLNPLIDVTLDKPKVPQAEGDSDLVHDGLVLNPLPLLKSDKPTPAADTADFVGGSTDSEGVLDNNK